MRCLVGLGNPGSAYAATRHNVGFQVVDALAARHGIDVAKRRHQALLGRGRIGEVEVLLVKPQTFMNDSGLAVRRVLEYYRLEPCHLLVVCDDINLDLGQLRLRRAGSPGGQKGLRSIGQHLGRTDFVRLRIGVGRLETGRDATGFVLSPFRASEREAADDALQQAADAVECALREGLEAAMGRYNS
ncbi:MAG: aminoacyl-tRNA hydrolase [Armatimonadetes bacterium]|nr:aminoacyl-tRNA hydrolase [Armatimonadota bacterium]